MARRRWEELWQLCHSRYVPRCLFHAHRALGRVGERVLLAFAITSHRPYT